MSIGFWENEKGNLFSYYKGLSIEQINELKQLKVGDRLVLYKNEVNGNKPHYNLKKASYINKSKEINENEDKNTIKN